MIKNKHFFPAYIFALLIFISSSLPTGQVQKARTYHWILDILLSDFFLHSCVFGLFAALLCWGFFKARDSSTPYIKIGLLSIIYGLFIELYQHILPYRSLRLDDIIANTVGVIAFLVLFKIFTIVLKHRQGVISSSK
ncbi:MAG: VanZ family protein [Candidatus Aminicenantes bacterium]|nr:MAG: VanZ family protein [Candidatus Aminicenantes bacterium]